MRTNELILYKNMEYEELLLDMTFLMEHYDNEYYNQEDLKGLLFSCMNELLELSECHGFFSRPPSITAFRYLYSISNSSKERSSM